MKYMLTLYVTGHTASSERAIQNLKQIMDQGIPGEPEVLIVDVLERPQMAEDEGILATPTLIRERPLPKRRIIGDLSDTDKVLLGLGLDSNRPQREETKL